MSIRTAIGKAAYRFGDAMCLNWDAGESSRIRKDLGWNRRTPRDEEASLAYDGTRELIRQKAMDLRRNNALIAGACERIASFAVADQGMIPQAQTTDQDWNKAAEAWFQEWGSLCDSRGRLTLPDLQWLACSMRPTHGGMYLQALVDGTVRPIEAERVRNPTKKAGEEGYVDGVKVDRATGRVVSYWVHGRDEKGTFSGKHAENRVDAGDMFAVINRPIRLDQVREVPDLAPIVPVMSDLHQMNQYVLNTAKVQSMIVGVLQKLNGRGANAMPRGTQTQTGGKRQTFDFEWGQVLEMFPGEDVNLKSSPTPGSTHIPYMKFELMLAACALDFPYEFLTLDFSTANLARQKGILLMVNKAIRNWQAWIVDRMLQPLWNWRIAMAMADGELPFAPIDPKTGRSQWSKVFWQGPEEPWSDRQEAQQADIFEIQAALMTFDSACKRRGRRFEENLRQRAEEEKLIDEVSAETGISRDRLVHLQIPGQTKATDSGKEEPEDMGDETKDDESKGASNETE